MAERTHHTPSTEKLQRRNRELSILNTIAAALNSSLDLDEALRVTLARVAELLDLHTGWIWLLDEQTGRPYLAAAQALPPGLARDSRRMEGWCYCLETFVAGDMGGAANINVVTCSRLRTLVDGTQGLRYHASIPLYAHEKPLGVLNVASTDWRELSADDLRLLHTVGDLLGIAIERARLFARSAQLGAVEERNRLAREIHDTLVQELAGVALQLESADALLEGEAERGRVQHALQRALTQTRASLEEARRSVLDLRAAPLEGRTLAQALAALVEEVRASAGLTIRFTVRGGNRPLPVRVEAGLYRIVREALANVARHAEARQVRVRLMATPDAVRCIVEDDGRGFDPAQAPQGHYGLIGLNERATLLGGRLRLKSTPGRGTRVEVIVPVASIAPPRAPEE